MLSEKLYEAALRLRRAYGNSAIKPLREYVDITDSINAYAIQNLNTQFWLSQGRHIIGKKIGLTSSAVQKQLGVNQPDYGILFHDMKIDDEGSLQGQKLLQPKVEAEIAVRLCKDIDDPNIELAEFIESIDAIAPALEIVDSRIEDWKISFADTVADNGSSSHFVIGAWLQDKSIDLYSCGMVLEKNGEICSLGTGAACLGHPYKAGLWLAKKMIEINQPLKAGEILLTGALGPMVAIYPGDHIKAVIGGLGECEFHFKEESI